MTFGPWGEAALGAREVLLKAPRRSAAETRDALAAGIADPAAPFRLGDLSRAQWFLWTGANLAAAERTGSLGEAGLPVGPQTDVETLLAVVGVLLGSGVARPELGDLGRGLGKSVGDLPPRLLLVGRAIGLLAGITRTLDPDLDVLGIVARYTDDP